VALQLGLQRSAKGGHQRVVFVFEHFFKSNWPPALIK
jgi:hypothetical protein